MANLLDYLDWRGDLTLGQDPFNEVDNLILAELSFVDFGGIVAPPGEGSGIPLYEAAERYFTRFPEGVDMGVLVPDAIPEMLEKMAACPRFRDMKLGCFADWLDNDTAGQVAALTIETGDGAVYLAFRGTDDTLAGWKEDFHLACVPEIPAQRLAVEYTRQTAKQYPRKKLRLGGPSKGGNLAVWAALNDPDRVRRRIQQVWSNDGPGFHEDILSLPEHQDVARRIVTIIPQSSLVGMILEHDEDYTVVESSEKGLMQHDGFSWEVKGPGFVRLGSVTRQGRHHDLVLKEWVRQMPLDQREKFVEGLFSLLTASGAQTLTDLKEENLKAVGAMIKAMKDMEKDTRDALLYAFRQLMRSGWKVLSEEWQQETGNKLKEAEQKLRTLRGKIE